MCVILQNFVEIGKADAEIWRFSIFKNYGRPPSWICCVRVLTTQDEHLVVLVVWQNLVGIDAVV